MPTEPVLIRVSVASMWQRFFGCEPDFIKDVCHSRCCDAPSKPGGSMVTIHRSEREAIEARGGTVGDDGFLVTEAGCNFKTDAFLCSLHTTPDKPFGCIASPFTLNAKDTLVVRNRYRRLPCYIRQAEHDHATYPPAFEAFRAGLDLIFEDEAVRVVEYLEHYGDPHDPDNRLDVPRLLSFVMPRRSYEILKDNDAAKRSASGAVP